MIKNFLIAAALVIASPALVFSQELFVSFDIDAATSTTSGDAGTSGTAYIFSDLPFSFDALDLDITSSDTSRLLLTGGSTFNEEFATLGGTAFDSSALTTTDTGANLFSVNVTQNGIKSNISPLGFNPHFDAGVGASGAVLLAEVTYDLSGTDGDVSLDLSLGEQGALLLPSDVLDPSFGSGTLTVSGTSDVPEPSSATLLILGAVGLVARRKRS